MLLLLSLLPMLSYVGHWNAGESGRAHTQADHTHASIAPAAHQPSGGALEEHAEHCHGEVASCTDSPPPVASGFSALAEGLRFLRTEDGAGVAVGDVWGLAAQTSLAPEPRPPRTST